MKAKKFQSAGESIQVVEEIVDTENANEVSPITPRKRRFDEIDSSPLVKVKSERSMSPSSVLARSNNSSAIKMEFDPPSAVDEETSNAASILNGVSMDRRPVSLSPKYMLILD